MSHTSFSKERPYADPAVLQPRSRSVEASRRVVLFLTLNDVERKQLVALGRHRSAPRGIVLRIDIVLGAAEGLANRVLARKLSTSVPTVLLWRKRFESDGIAGIVEDRPRSGRPKRISVEKEAGIVEATMKTTPKDATQWSVRAMAAAQKVSSATVQRIWKKHKLQPHRVESFKFSNDPPFARKVRDIVVRRGTMRDCCLYQAFSTTP